MNEMEQCECRNQSKLLIGLYQAHRYGNLNMEYKIKKTHRGILRFFYFVGSKKARTKSQLELQVAPFGTTQR
jgi:hypothetical protein